MKKNKILKISKYITKGAVVAGLVFAISTVSLFSHNFQASTNVTATTPSRAEVVALQIGTREAAPRRGVAGLNITGEIPYANLVGLNSADFNDELNERFIEQRDDFVQAHRARTPNLEFDTTIHVFGDYVSVVIEMTARGVTITRNAATTVINTATMQIVPMTDFNPNMLQLANSRFELMILAAPRSYVATFDGIDLTHPFYLSESSLNIPFASATFLAGTRSIVNVNFSFNDIQNEIVEDIFFHNIMVNQYSVTMVQVAEIAERFGFAVSRTGNSFSLRRDGVVVSFAVGVNSYVIDGAARPLEVAPRLQAGEAYVPLSFFREILGFATTVISENEILISEWRTSSDNADLSVNEILPR